MIKIISFFRDYGEEIAMIAILLVILILCLRDFNVFSKRSWALLLGISALGGFVIFRGWKRKRLQAELKEREEKLKQIEGRYEILQYKNKIAKQNFDNAKNSLEEAKKSTSVKMLMADKEHEDRLLEIEKDYKNMSSQELADRIDKILSSK